MSITVVTTEAVREEAQLISPELRDPFRETVFAAPAAKFGARVAAPVDGIPEDKWVGANLVPSVSFKDRRGTFLDPFAEVPTVGPTEDTPEGPRATLSSPAEP